MSQTAIRCSVIRGGTSKGLYFHVDDLPADRATRDAVLLAAMGSPDPREIDGMGGAHPLTSKVAVVARSARENADVDYLFLQVWPDRAEVSDNQNCGNLLAGVGPFAVEEGLITPTGDVTPVRIWMENTQTLAVAHVQTPAGKVRYDGNSGDRRRAGNARTDSDRLSRRRRLDMWCAAPDRQRGRRGQRHQGDLHRQRDAGRLHQGGRSWASRPREPVRHRSEHRTSSGVSKTSGSPSDR